MANINRLIFAYIVAALMIASTSAQLILPGECATNVTGVQRFQMPKFLGRWYEIARQRSGAAAEADSRCTSAQLEPINDNSIRLLTSQISRATGERSVAQSVGRTGPTGEIRVRFPAMPAAPNRPNFVVVSTDYERYAVVYVCANLSPLNAKGILILTRERLPEPRTLLQARQAAAGSGFSLRGLTPTDQTNC